MTRASFATMHFIGNAALWLQTYEAEHDIDSWEELCVAIHEKFGKNKHHRYLEALENVNKRKPCLNITRNSRSLDIRF
jgi:hypothetical protein